MMKTIRFCINACYASSGRHSICVDIKERRDVEERLERCGLGHDGVFVFMAALLEDLLSSLRKEKRKIEEEAWRYAAPRSQPKLMS